MGGVICYIKLHNFIKTCLTLEQAAVHTTEVHFADMQARDPRGCSGQVLKAHLNLGARLPQPTNQPPPQSMT